MPSSDCSYDMLMHAVNSSLLIMTFSLNGCGIGANIFFFFWCDTAIEIVIQNEKKMFIYCNVLKADFHHLFHHRWVYMLGWSQVLRALRGEYSPAKGCCGTVLAVAVCLNSTVLHHVPGPVSTSLTLQVSFFLTEFFTFDFLVSALLYPTVCPQQYILLLVVSFSVFFSLLDPLTVSHLSSLTSG